MRTFGALLVCLIHACKARRLQSLYDEVQGGPQHVTSESNRMQALASLLEAMDPSMGFMPSGPGMNSNGGANYAPLQRALQRRPLRMQSAVSAELENLESMTVAQLKPLLKARGLKVSGKKAELIERLQEHDGSQEHAPEEVEQSPKTAAVKKTLKPKPVKLEMPAEDLTSSAEVLLAKSQQMLEAAPGLEEEDLQESEATTLRQATPINGKVLEVAEPPVSKEEPARSTQPETPRNTMSAEEYRKEHEISVEGGHADEFPPIPNFEDAPFTQGLKDVFSSMGYTKPTPIQAQSWPIAMAGRDMISIAKTGSGKTVAFLLPALHKLMEEAGRSSQQQEAPEERVERRKDSDGVAYAKEDFIEYYGEEDGESKWKSAPVARGDDTCIANIDIDGRLVPSIIGAKGATVKTLQRETGCWIKCVSGADRNGPAKVVIKGTVDNVAKAMQALEGFRNTAEPVILVLGPTRELVVQIDKEAQKYTEAAGVHATAIYGGVGKREQLKQLEKNPKVIAATPGRCNDLLSMNILDLSKVDYVVLDEADRMLDMGFEPQIRVILEQTPRSRQTLMFSATWPKTVRALASDFLRSPVHVNVGDGDILNANKAIDQRILMVPEHMKEDELVELMRSLNADLNADPEDMRKFPKMIVFARRKTQCDFLAHKLTTMGYLAEAMHGDMPQDYREDVMSRFRRGGIRIMVATDVAARGLDVKDIKVVLNYDMPAGKGTDGAEDYVHRIGRTARGEDTGIAYSFVTDDDYNIARSLVGVLERSGAEVPDKLRTMRRPAKGQGNRGKPGFGNRGYDMYDPQGSGGYSAYGGDNYFDNTKRDPYSLNLGASLRQDKKQRRVDPDDGNAYTQLEFMNLYGRRGWREVWEKADVYGGETRSR